MTGRWRAEPSEAAAHELETVKRVGLLKERIEAVTTSVLDSYGMTYAEFELLAALRRSGPPHRLTRDELAARCALRSDAIHSTVRRLRAAGLVEQGAGPGGDGTRHGGPADSAADWWIRLTPLGVDRADELAMATTDAHKAILAHLSQTTARTLADLLRDVLLILGESPAPPSRSR